MPSAGAHGLWKQADTYTHLRDIVNLEIICVFILETLRIVLWVRCWMGFYFLNLHPPHPIGSYRCPQHDGSLPKTCLCPLFHTQWLMWTCLANVTSSSMLFGPLEGECGNLELGLRDSGFQVPCEWPHASQRCVEDDAFTLWSQKQRQQRIWKNQEMRHTGERQRHCQVPRHSSLLFLEFLGTTVIFF